MRLALVAAAIVVATALSACGSSSKHAKAKHAKPPQAQLAVQRAAAATVAAGGERVTLAGSMQIQGNTVAVVGHGKFGPQGGNASLVLNLPPAAVQQLHVKAIPLGVIVQGLVVYVKLPESISGVKTPWIKVDRSIRTEKVVLNEQILTEVDQADASEMLQFLRGAGKAKRIGPAVVGGVQTTHYHVVINLDTAPNALPLAERAPVQRAAAGLIRTTGFDNYPSDVWVDAKGRVRRMSFSVAFPTSAGATTLTMRVDLSGFGTHVKTAPPPRSETTDATSLQGQGQAG